MAKKLGFVVMLSMCLLIVEFVHAQEDSPSPAVSPGRKSPMDSPLPPSLSPEADSPLPPSLSPEADSPQPPASSPQPESLADSPSPPPPPPQPESPSFPSPSPSSPVPAPEPAPSDDDNDDDSEPETEYFPSPTPSPAPELGMPDDIKASEEGGDEFEDKNGEDSGMSGLKKAVIAIGAIIGVGTIVIGALVYKKRRDNMTRARYTYFTEGEFL